jgi:hypothetical protein
MKTQTSQPMSAAEIQRARNISDAELRELEQSMQATLLADEIEHHAKALADRLCIASIRLTLHDSPDAARVSDASQLIGNFCDSSVPWIQTSIIVGFPPKPSQGTPI